MSLIKLTVTQTLYRSFMKNVFLGLALTLSFSAFAESVIVDVARLDNCGGRVELRSYESQGEEKFALQFEGVKSCSNVRLSSGKDYKLTDKNGKFVESKNITLSDEAVSAARSRRGLGVIVESNKGSTVDAVAVQIESAPVSIPSSPSSSSEEYEPTGWN
jgi:hypothetical protein